MRPRTEIFKNDKFDDPIVVRNNGSIVCNVKSVCHRGWIELSERMHFDSNRRTTGSFLFELEMDPMENFRFFPLFS